MPARLNNLRSAVVFFRIEKMDAMVLFFSPLAMLLLSREPPPPPDDSSWTLLGSMCVWGKMPQCFEDVPDQHQWSV